MWLHVSAGEDEGVEMNGGMEMNGDGFQKGLTFWNSNTFPEILVAT